MPKPSTPVATHSALSVTRTRRAVLALCASTLLGPLAMSGAHAQTAPSSLPKTIRLVVPLGAGSAPDAIARRLAENMGAALGRTVLVENRPGNSGFIAGDSVVKSPADGSSLYVTVSSFVVIAPQVYRKVPYNALKDLKPLTQLGTTPIAWSVAANSPIQSLADLIAAAKRAPDTLTYASYGNGTAAHLIAEAFSKQAGIQLRHIPYKTTATPDLIGGVVATNLTDLGSVKPYLAKPAKVRTIAITGAKRVPEFPDVPTFHEQGFAQLDAMMGWLGVFAPAGLPAQATAELNAAIATSLKDPKMREAMSTVAYTPTGVAGDAFAQLVQGDHQRWGQVLTAMGGLQLD